MFAAVYSRKQAIVMATHTKLVILFFLVNINLVPFRAVC